MDYESFKDIAPYDQKDCEEAIKRIQQHPEYMNMFAKALIKGDGLLVQAARKAFSAYVMTRLNKIHSYTDFQKNITCGIFFPTVLKNTSKEFTVSGLENLKKDGAYLFISNHRDIILDCGLMDYALFKNDYPLCEMCTGDNLLANQFIVDLFKLDGGIIVKRSLPMKEKYLETVRLSQYMVETIESGTSIWVAQKSGRSKDGIDTTHPAIVKMLHLSQRKNGSYADTIKRCHIIPVAISYEYDPNDISKAREAIHTEREGTYEKRKFEDLASMLRGLRKNKGRIHLSFGKELTGEYNEAVEVAHEIDRQIYEIYKLWPVNYFCFDYAEKKSDFADKYKDFDSEAFLKKYAHLDEEKRMFVINSYANPVRTHLGLIKSE
ncbi:MAG: 1-acyl-sn-glycerol-3-phosphate acyltransferase [Sphaerochaetaceae bacterium]|nr:1-acyl-sn-glycerol-3-phosphate acyltransferase [Sphaerochaetaceae bacterium]